MELLSSKEAVKSAPGSVRKELEIGMKRNKFSGKRLLILGSNVGATDMVKYARAHGAITMVADYFPPEKSPAKQEADEHFLISTADMESLCRLVRDHHVNGVLSGISDFNVLNALELSERCGLPFYCNKGQWDLVSRKDHFRSLCQRCHVPVPRTYYIGNKIPDDLFQALPYPVVVKPVDASLSIGVSICRNEKDLRSGEEKALAESSVRKIIVEEYISGQEFTAHYTISNGESFFACLDNRYPAAIHPGSGTTIPIARLYPSLFLEEYRAQVNESMLGLCREIGLQNGVLFIQGIYKDNCFFIFEGGLRCAGEAPYRFIEPINGLNCLHVLVDHVLLKKAEEYDGNKEDPSLKGKCCGVISFATKGGRVAAIQGLEEAIAGIPSVIAHECRYLPGSEAPSGNTLRQIQLRFVMICESREQLAKDIQYVNETVSVLNEQGQDMCLRFDPNQLFGDLR